MHITAFGVKLDEEQKQLEILGILISNKDKLQFYMEQINLSNIFDKKEMINWENKPIMMKDDYDEAKLYVKNFVKDFETYTHNSGGTLVKQGYKSTNMAADLGNELQKYIQEFASAAAAEKESAANISEITKAKDAQILALTAQIKTLMDAFAALTKSLTNKDNVPPNTGNTNNGTTPRAFHWMRNMGAYCWLHGHHLVGTKHTSCACMKKKEGHINNATATNCQGKDNFW